MATKTAPAPKNTDAAGRGYNITEAMIGKPVPVKEIAFQARSLSQKYVPLVNAVISMKPGTGIELAIPKDADVDNFRATISTTLRKRTAEIYGKDKPCRLSFGITENGKALVISVIKNPA